MRVYLIALVLACGCSKNNSNYCANAPDHNCSEMPDGPPGVDAAMGCQAQAECTTSAAPVCDLVKHECVACNSDYANTCPAATPVCNTSAEVCRKCAAHSECGSPGACLPNGTCGSDGNVAWVAPGGSDNGTCTLAAPCMTITHALLQNRPYIKVASGTIMDQATIQQDVTILSEAGAKLQPSSGSAIIIKGSSKVTIHDLAVTGAAASGAAGVMVAFGDTPTVSLDHVYVINNAGFGLYVQGGSLTMSRCVVSGNNGGGASIAMTDFDISNSLFVQNGSTTSTTGGLTLAPTSTYAFRFNTIADNVSTTGTASQRGIACAIPLSATNVIVSGNLAQTTCTFDYSLFDTGTATNHNKIGNAMFETVDVLAPMATTYYRIGSASAAIDNGDPASTLNMDIDDHMRPDGGTFDIGASEY